MARASRCPSSMGGRGILPGRRPRALASRSLGNMYVRAHAHAGTDTAAVQLRRPAGRARGTEPHAGAGSGEGSVQYRAERRSQASGAGAVRF